MCGNFPNIKVVEGNAFSLVLPLKRRTFESCQPIDEDIDATQLTDVVVKFGGVEYTPSLGVDGVTIILPATLARGTYDIVLTAKYQGTDIRAAYESAISIVPWNSQSDAQQFVPGSPIVCDAAYVIGGALTDEELEQLKEEYREKNAQLDQAIADAEEAKREWEQKAAELDDVAQESTLTQGVQDIREDISHINIDTTTLAKEATSQQILQVVQTIAPDPSGQQAVSAAIVAKGGVSQPTDSLYEMSQEILAIPLVPQSAEWVVGKTPQSVAEAFANVPYVKSFIDERTESAAFAERFKYFSNLEYVKFSNLQQITDTAMGTFTQITTLRKAEFPALLSIVGGNQSTAMFYNSGIVELYMPNLIVAPSYFTLQSMPYLEKADFTNTYFANHSRAFGSCLNLIELHTGVNFLSGSWLDYWNPTNALNSSSSSLVKEGETFANNLEKLLYNIRAYIVTNLPDRTGQTSPQIHFHANVKAAIQADQTTADAFAAKNWTIV